MNLKVLGVSSSMRDISYSTHTLKLVLEKVQDKGAKTRLLNLQETRLPMYSPEQNNSPGDRYGYRECKVGRCFDSSFA